MEIIRPAGAGISADGARTVVALGFFDGMHRAHTALLARAAALARKLGATPVVCSFGDAGIKPGVPRLLSEEEKLRRMAASGMARAYLLDFSAVRDLAPADFAQSVLLGGLGAAGAVCGYNFRFGRGGAGDAAALRALLAPAGCRTEILPAMTVGGVPVSASEIRAALEAGDAAAAGRLLGRPYSLSGRVLHGKALGRTIGIPTANLAFPRGRLVPSHGVYAVLCRLGDGGDPPGDGFLPGMANVGVRPTVEESGAVNCETHLLCGDAGDLYGKELTVYFIRRLRGEIKFGSVDALHTQLLRDRNAAKEYLLTWENGRN